MLADLPGYGYAAVSRSDKQRWQQVMANYLVSRKSLTGHRAAVRSAPGADRTRRGAAGGGAPACRAGLKFLVLLTKADKLTRSEQAKALSITGCNAGGGEVRLFSPLKLGWKNTGRGRVGAPLLWPWNLAEPDGWRWTRTFYASPAPTGRHRPKDATHLRGI